MSSIEQTEFGNGGTGNTIQTAHTSDDEYRKRVLKGKLLNIFTF